MVKKQITLKPNLIAEILGWYGAVAIILAYFLVSFGFIQSGSLLFQGLNLTGAVGIVIISIVKREKQTVVLNLFWGAIAALALIQLIFK